MKPVLNEVVREALRIRTYTKNVTPSYLVPGGLLQQRDSRPSVRTGQSGLASLVVNIRVHPRIEGDDER